VKKTESAGLLEKGLPNDQLKIIYSEAKQIIAELNLDSTGSWKELDEVFEVENEPTTNPGTGSS
jgi:hypothetical protein